MEAVKAIDNIWVLIAAFLVFFMQAGFAMVEVGFTRAKNTVNILMKNLMDFSLLSQRLMRMIEVVSLDISV